MDKREMFYALADADESLNGDGCDFLSALAVYEKLWWALAVKAMGSKTSYPFIMKEDGRVYQLESDTYTAEENGEVMMHETLAGSDVDSYICRYYLDSPYWDYDCRYAAVYDCELDALSEEEKEDFAVLTEYLYEDFFEDKALDMFRTQVAMAPVEYFSLGDAEAMSCLCLKSYLLPHYLTLDNKRKVVMQEHPKLYGLIEKAISVLSHCLAGGSQTILEKDMEASYFICFDDFCGAYGYGRRGEGTAYVNKGLLMAGMILDEALMELDSYYHFLPDELREKEEVPAA